MINEAQFKALQKPIAIIVDDEPLILMDTADIIADAGYSIVEATTAEQAYEFLKQHSSVELLFTDVQTPGTIDGFELARAVAEQWPEICVVVVSGAAIPADGELPANADFISKPFSAEAVLEILREKCPHHPSLN